MQYRPVVYGAAYSVYVQAVRLTLWAKRVPYDLIEVDVFGPTGPPKEYLLRHPFGRIPAFEHGALRMYETAPICRYVATSTKRSRDRSYSHLSHHPGR